MVGIAKRIFTKAKSAGKDPLLSPNRLTAYNGGILDTLGCVTLPCKRKGIDQKLDFYIVETSASPILGLKASVDFQLIKLVLSCDSTTSTESSFLTREKVLEEYPDMFKGVGLFPGECTIHVDPSIPPIVHPPRRVPVALRDKIKQELDRMVEQDIICKVTEPTQWVSSLVYPQKPNGKLRICLDPKDLNNAIKRPHYPLKTLDDILPRLTGAKFFSKLDARSGYWSIKLTTESSYLTCFNTPFGRYRFLRMPFGVRSAQDEFQQRIDTCFEGLEGVVAIVDDILIFGGSQEEHDLNLKRVLERAEAKGIRFNPEKMEIGVTEVQYFGNIISSSGLKPSPDKISAIKDMSPPSNKNELETILGTINYLSRFAPNLSEITLPMRQLLSKDAEFIWDEAQKTAFQKVKEILTCVPGPVLAFYDPSKELTLQVDASRSGLGATILQEGRPVAYASKSLTPSEVNYAQIELEMYGILFGCKRFHQYIYGRKISVQTDHLPLVPIMKKPLHVAPPRLQRMMLQLQPYDIEVSHVPGKLIPLADCLSRKSLPDTYPELTEGMDCQVHMVISSLPISDRKLKEIKQMTDQDPTLETLKSVVMQGWPELRKHCPESILDFWNYRDELSVIDGLILKGQNIIIPAALRSRMLDILHVGHFGCDKTLRRARDLMFWPRISADIKEMVLNCSTCIEHRNSNAKEPLLPHEIPEYPWQNVATDLFTWDDKNYIIIVDYYSNYFEVEILSSTKSSAIVSKLKRVFSTHGIPEKVVSDNGPQFSSQEFREFADHWDFHHSKISPGLSNSNGLAEKMVGIAK
ncbi:MAG: RNase H-like domain-containing protein, partial [Candidatus Thiodiazotropha sp.]